MLTDEQKRIVSIVHNSDLRLRKPDVSVAAFLVGYLLAGKFANNQKAARFQSCILEYLVNGNHESVTPITSEEIELEKLVNYNEPEPEFM